MAINDDELNGLIEKKALDAFGKIRQQITKGSLLELLKLAD